MPTPGDHPPPPHIPGIKAEGHLLRMMQEEVANLLGRKSTRFPGAQPVSFAAKHIHELQKQDYFVCEKSDGIRCLMYLTNDGDREVTYLIDRKNDYYWVQGLHFPPPNDESAFHTNTIIDGELVNDRERDGSIQMKYLVFDCLMLSGAPLIQRTLDKRLAYYRDRVYNPHHAVYEKYPQKKVERPFIVQFKKMEKAYGIEMILKQTLPNLPHGSDGLIFTCVKTPYEFGTDPHILKWKPANENTIDFLLSLEFPALDPDSEDEKEGITEPYPDYLAKPTLHLFVGGDRGVPMQYSTMFVTDEEWADLKGRGEPLDERIVECYQDESHQWRFHRFRDDKHDANHTSTVDSVIESIQDRVEDKDLIAVQGQIREAWKAREANGPVNGHEG